MKDRQRSLLGAALTAFALCLALLPAVAVSATTGTMQITADTTLTEDHAGRIEIIADNVTLDCDGHKVTGSGTGNGIELSGRAGVTVRSCDVSGFEHGIMLWDSDDNTIEENHAHDNVSGDLSTGIRVRGSSNNNIAGNTVIGNGQFGIGLRYSDNNTISGNEARNNGGCGFTIVDSEDVMVSGNEARKNGICGFDIGRAWGTTITNNEAWSNGWVGFWFDDSQNAIVLGNTASENTVEGFRSVDSTATFTDNDAHRNGDWGFDVDFTSHNTFKGNSCTGNGLGGSLPSGLCQEEQVGLVDTSSGMWYLRHSDLSVLSFYYGNPGDVPFMGDWDCDTVATPGLFRTSDAYAYLRNSNSQGIADIRFFFGNPSDVPLAGDFNGDGCDTLSIYRPSEARFYIINKLGENEGGLGAAEYSFLFGNVGDKPVVGDWDGDGVDEIGLHRETTGFFYYRNTLTTGNADGQFYFGDPGDRFVSGDWGVVDGVETPAMFRPSNSTFYFRHTLTQGNADSQFVWPDSSAGSNWLPVSGDVTLD